MRQRWLCLSVLAISWGCGGNDLPLAPTPARVVTTAPPPAPTLPFRDGGNWTPFYFQAWKPGIGAPLSLNADVDDAVDGQLCVSDIYDQWGARACQRFVVSVPSAGWLHAFLRWDTSALDFRIDLAGEVVLVASDGRFALSDWKRAEAEVFARVTPGIYDLLVMAYAQTRLPFRLRAELRSE